MTRRFLSSRSLPLVFAVLAACSGGEPGGTAPQPTASLTVAATGLPVGFTAPFTVFREGQTVATAALSGSETRTYQGLPYGRYVVRWGQRVALINGDIHTYAAAEDTTMVAGADPPAVVTGEFSPITGGIEVSPTGAPPGVSLNFRVYPLAGGPSSPSTAIVGSPRRVTNLSPGAYLLVFYETINLVNGLYQSVISPDTLLATVAVGATLTPVAPVYRARYAMIDVVVLGLPADLKAPWGYTNLISSFSSGSSVPPGPARLFIPYEGAMLAEWGTVTARDTTWVATYNPGPFAIVPSFTPVAGDTIRYAAQ